MKIWVVTVGESLPVSPGNDRLWRSGLICKMLADEGHDVTWWTSTFLHAQKRHLFGDDHIVRLAANYTIRLLHARGYARNVSIARLIDHWQIARKFARNAKTSSHRPDIVLCSFPTIDLCYEAVRYGQTAGIPIVIDIRDLWPDVFLNLAPRALRPVARLLLWPMYRRARFALSNARALVAINDSYIRWGLARARRDITPLDRSFPLAYPSSMPSEEDRERARRFWHRLGIVERDGTFKAIFFGAIGRQFEFDTIIEAARKLADSNIIIILCGVGDRFDSIRRTASDIPNLLLPGWVGAAEIWTLMRMAQVGLAPYPDDENFSVSLPNKILEYLSAGLPIVSSLPGTLASFLAQQGCGITYTNQDADALVTALRELRDHPERCAEMSQSAEAAYETGFRADAVYPKMIQHLDMIARTTGSHAISQKGYATV